MEINAEKVDGGWIVFANSALDVRKKTKVIVDDDELIKYFSDFVKTQPVQLNEG